MIVGIKQHLVRLQEISNSYIANQIATINTHIVAEVNGEITEKNQNI